jgi:3-oxoacyl-[acyl-carrier protein] reductase
MELPETTPVAKAFDLSGRVAVITGAASGIGRASAVIMGGAGAKVVLGDVDPDGLAAVAKQITDAGGTASTRVTDVSRRADVDALVAQATQEHGRLDIMANIAGIGSRALVVDITDEQLDKVIGINLKGVLYGCQAAMRVMVPQGTGGSIVNVASGIIDSAGPTYGPYAMTKAAVAILTKTLAAEAGEHGIRVNAVAPGTILTNFSLPHFTNEDGTVDEGRKEAFTKMASGYARLGRIGTASDVAWSIMYLVSDAACFVTGQTMRPNGGTAMP